MFPPYLMMILAFLHKCHMQHLILYTFCFALSRLFRRIFQIYYIFFRFLCKSLCFSLFLWIRFTFYFASEYKRINQNAQGIKSISRIYWICQSILGNSAMGLLFCPDHIWMFFASDAEHRLSRSRNLPRSLFFKWILPSVIL